MIVGLPMGTTEDVHRSSVGWAVVVVAWLVVGCSDDGLNDAAGGEGATEAATEGADDEAASSDGEGATSGPGTGDGSSGMADEPELPDFFQLQLTDAWACDDLQVHLADPARTLMLTVDWPDC